MLENQPVLVDRLKALGVFSGIAVGAVAGLELVIGGGFDFITPGQSIREVAPSRYVQVADSLWSPDARVVALSSNEPYFIGDDAQAATDVDLAGDADAPVGDYPQTASSDELYADIQALYEEMDAQRAARSTYQPARYVEDQSQGFSEANYTSEHEPSADDKKPDVTSYETELPW